MRVLCVDLDSFFDGELSAEEAVTFRVHLGTCMRCQEALRGRMQEEVVAGAAYERVEQPRGSDAKPPHLNIRRRRIVTLIPLLAAAAAFMIWLIGTRGAEQAKPIELSLTIERHVEPKRGSPTRSTLAHVGDILRPVLRGGRYRAIWVYLGDRDLLIACPGDTQCDNTDDKLTLGFRVTALGQYSIIALGSEKPIMAPHGALDVMLSAAAAAGISFKIQHVDVN